jgi:D-alanyl-D-alanine carboxypeptidase
VVDYGIALPPSFPPGTGWEYSNTNYVMLGLIIEAVTGQEIRVVLQEQILDPLGLSNTSFPAQDDDSIPAPYARGRTVQGQPDGQTADATNWNPSWAWTAGQMISDLDDMHVWARVLGTGELLSPELQAQREQWVTIGPDAYYGLGIANFSGWLGHNGELPGYNSDSWYRPDLAATILVFTNSDINNPELRSTPSGAVFSGIRTILNREYPLPVAEE